MPADEVTHGTDVDASRVRTGPRHAAPKKPLFTRFHMPAGKAIAMAAMPTAVLVGMGFTSSLALADSAGSTPAPAKSLSAEEYKDCVAALDGSSASPSPSASSSASPKADDTKTPSPSASTAAPKDDDKEPSGSDDTTSSPDSGSDDKAEPTPSPSESASAAGGAAGGAATPSASASAGGGGLLGTIGDVVSGILTGGASGTAQEAAPSPSASASAPADEDASDAAEKAAEKTAGKAADKVTDTVSGTVEDAGRAAKDTAGTAGDAAKDTADAAGKAADEATSAATPSPSASASEAADGCPAATDDEGGVDNKVPVSDDPWHLDASSLLLKSADYQGVVEVRTASGVKKKVLKYVISGGTDIGDLHQTVLDSQSGKTYHVQAAKGSTSTIRNGDTTMYTESISGNLFGLIPVTFSPDSPPPLNIPLIYFTNAKVVQAAQFGGELHVPGLHQYATG
ncbi:hypothetical protein ABZ439_14420 [Streptomyces sp. NPDC005840]|uniref:hypothetical protein n=1 Tax=Streptomyces sp. NPDC005840 TaxID=3157072 RepID=UPI0033F8EFB6